MRRIFPLLLVAWFGSAETAGAEVYLTMQDGRVTLKANNATIAEILREWAKVGKTRIINGEMVTTELVSIELTDVSEGRALDVILRSVAGYIAASRPADMANLSRFDRILILPTSTPPRSAASTAPSPRPQDSPYPQFPALPHDAAYDVTELATPNPQGAVGSTYPAYSQAPPVWVSPSPDSIRSDSAPAGSPTRGQMATGASVPGMPVQRASQTPPAYPPNPIRNPPD